MRTLLSMERVTDSSLKSLQVITVFLGSVIGGTLFNQFNQWIDSPSSAVTILGTAVPLTSMFFLTYISLQVWGYFNMLNLFVILSPSYTMPQFMWQPNVGRGVRFLRAVSGSQGFWILGFGRHSL